MKELKWTDHLGQEFKSQRTMLEHWGINLNTLYRRLRMNYSLKDALELPVKERENKIECYGLVFEGFLSFANYLQAEINTVIDKYNQGETPEEIHDKFVCNVGVDGKLFNRVKELSKYTGISMHTFLLQIKKWTYV